MKKLTIAGKVSVIIVILCLVSLWFLPMWRIDLRAPQYPGGLSMQIWINDIKGDVPIINGLNHYIGMKTIEKKDFPEFIFLPTTMLIFMGLGLVVLLLGRKIGYYLWAGLFIFIAIFSFYDFYKWEYNYGHNLDPHAPIRVPGMSYQPPLLGYKKLLNFEILSQPDVAGWLYIIAGVILVSVTFYEWKKSIAK
jgi:copper chaperone NosL